MCFVDAVCDRSLCSAAVHSFNQSLLCTIVPQTAPIMSCDLLIDCCATQDWDALEKHARQISQAINKREYEIGKVIAELRGMLTDSNESNRSNGMKIISSVLISLDSGILNENEVLCILEFFNNRLKDRIPVIEDSLSGLKALCQFGHFNFEMASSLFFVIQNEVSIQLLKPDCKVQLYKIVKVLFGRFKSDFIGLGSNFVYGFLQIVDAETSPTCLVEVFELFHDVASIKKFELFKEDLFEAMACYFPIIYNKQKNDKYMETKIHLSSLLNRAMAASSCFAEYVIQLALEKLESESVGSKQSCYQLLECALPNYNLSQVEQFIHELWTFIRIDTLKPTLECDELATHALLALAKLGDLLSANSAVCSSFLEKIWKDLEISLKSPELNLINSSIKIFTALSSNNIDVFCFFFDRSHPILLQNFLFNTELKHQSLCLSALYDLLIYGKRIDFIFQSDTVVRLFDILIDHSSNGIDLQLRKNALLFINELVCVHQLDEVHIVKLSKYLEKYAEQSDYNTILMNPAFELIKNVCLHNPHQVLALYIEPLQKEIESFVHSESVNLQNRLLYQLGVLRSASFELTIFNSISDFILARLIYFLRDSENQFFQNCSLNLLETLEVAFSALLSNTESDGKFLESWHQTIIDPLLDKCIRFCFEQNLPLSTEVIQKISLLFSKFITVSDIDTKERISNRIVKLVIDRNIADFVKDQGETMPWTELVPSKLSATQMYFFLGLIYSYYSSRSTTLNSEISVSVFNQVRSYCVEYLPCDPKLTHLSSMILSQIIIDASNAQISVLGEETFHQMKSLIQSADVLSERKTVALSILMWTSKSLLILNHALFVDYVQFFLQMLDQDTMVSQLLSLIDILYSSEDFFQMPPSADLLIPSPRFSTKLHELILERYSQSKKSAFLFLFVSHLRFIPHEMFSSQISQFFLLILSGLEATHQAQINRISLSFVESILKSNYSLVQPHIVSLFRSVISLSRAGTQLQIRQIALDCICLMIELADEQELLNYKVEFLRNLQPTLADRKRLVRSSAVKAFCKLSMLGQPGSASKL